MRGTTLAVISGGPAGIAIGVVLAGAGIVLLRFSVPLGKLYEGFKGLFPLGRYYPTVLSTHVAPALLIAFGLLVIWASIIH
jgi:hypothetical protein